MEASVTDYENGHIKRHEYTIKKKEADRTKLTDVQSANIGPVFLTFKTSTPTGKSIEEHINEIVKSREPYKHVLCDDEVGHAMWKCTPEESKWFTTNFEDVPATYVADGHHRTQAAYNVGNMHKERAKLAGVPITGDEDFNFFMAIHYPDNNLKVLEYNRVLKTLEGHTNEEFLAKIGENYDVTEMAEGADHNPTKKGTQCLLLG